ncbi:precorrin-3B synthase [Ancylobacter sp. SL191]|uniref:precorrin-3B synthase n=1 Tax=Ancylobacter sp. SL191 TaxID=2995166 RepID=UPI002270C531|nr:precorrin-3B synthase [Ancylobacter sp. SL191]WAC25546.1 precorrin-3B synthase [Ancylobacter sp. SL191]
MSAASDIDTLRRGACPSLPEPMPTGDGLLARLQPAAPLTLDQLAGLARLASVLGNGILEVTARGKLQLRGLSPETAGQLEAGVAALGIALPDGFPVEISALAGRDPSGLVDPRPLAEGVGQGAAGLVPHLAPKASVVIDAGGRLSLAALKADIAATAIPGGWRIDLAGQPAGVVETARAADAILRLLTLLAEAGPTARMAGLVAGKGLATLAETAGLSPLTTEAARVSVDPVGIHELIDGTHALGIGLAFGQMRAEALSALVAAARAAGVADVEPAAGRALLLTGLAPEAARALQSEATRLGFLTDPADPLRRVSACAGQPACASARIETHALARALAPLIGEGELHVSGCIKGCAHPARTRLTVVGLDAGAGLVVEGTPRDVPRRVLPLAGLRAGVAHWLEKGD